MSGRQTGNFATGCTSARSVLCSGRNDVLDAILDRLQILDLLAVSHVCSALRQSVDHDNGHRWRLAVFRRYYAGRTFRAALQEGQWSVTPPANQFSFSLSSDTHEWLPADMCGRPGGCETYRKTIDDPYLPAAQVTSYVVHAAAAVGGGGTRVDDAMPAAGSRVRTSHKDFVNTDIVTFFDTPENKMTPENTQRGRWPFKPYLRYGPRHRLLAAGRSGWKAFAVVLYACIDPEGRLDTLLHHKWLAKLDKGDEEWFERVALAAGAKAWGWQPTDGVFPICRIDGFDREAQVEFFSIFLPANIDLAPGFLSTERRYNRHPDDGDRTELGWTPYFGILTEMSGLRTTPPYFGDEWSAETWNHFWRLMFLCNSRRTEVDFEKFTGSRWERFDVTEYAPGLIGSP